MADNVAITAGSGTTVAADEVIDGTLGTVKVQYVKIMDGTLDGTSKVAVGANGIAVNDGLLNTATGVIGDTAATAGGSGSLLALLRAISRDLVANIVLKAGSAIIGKVGIDQTTPGTTDSVTVATGQGAGATIGATADAAVTAGATGSISAKLRSISRDIVANIVLAAGSAIIGKVGIDQTTPGTTDSVSVSTAQGAGAAIGVTSGAAVVTDANGTIQQYLRGLVKLWIAGLAAGEAHVGEVGGNLTMLSVEITRPADTTAYAANDSVSDSTSATTMQALANAARVSGGSGYITGIRVTTDKKSITPRFRLHFFNTNGATVTNDNAAFKTAYADISKSVGYWDMPAMITGADTTNSTDSRSFDLTPRLPYTCAATTLYVLLETLDAFTPASGQKISVTLFLDRN